MSNQLRAFLDTITAIVLIGILSVLFRLGVEWLEANYTLEQIRSTFGTICLIFLMYIGYSFRLGQLEAQETLDKLKS